MVKFDKQTILSFSKETNNSPFENAYSKTHYIISLIMKDIMDVNPYINNYELYVANEIFTGAEIPASTLDLFLAIDAKQIELNFNEDKLYKIKNNIINFGKRFASNFKLFSSKKKSRKQKKKDAKEIEEEFEKYNIDEKRLNNYNIRNFNIDLMQELAKYFTEKTNLVVSDNCIKISGKDDLGVFLKIYVVFINEDDNSYSLYNLNTKAKTIVNFRDRFENLDLINLRTNDMFTRQIAIFNNMFYNIFKYTPNQILIESLLYSCPIELFNNEVYETTVCLINYLKNTSLKDLVSICDNKELLKENLLYKNSTEFLYKFIKNLNISNN